MKSKQSKTNYHQTEGIVLRRQVYKETSLLCHCLTRDYGIITIIATGAVKEQSQFTGLLEPFNQLSLDLYKTARSEIFNLKSAGLIKIHSEKSNYKTTLLMSAAVELFLQIDFTDGDSEDTYLLLKNYFVFLKDSPYNQFLLFIRLALRTLQYIGIPLELCCHKCGNSEVIYFAPQEDAFLCENCTDRRMSDFLLSIDRDAVASLRNVYNLKNEDPDHTSEAIVLDFKKILLTHLENHFNKRFYLKSLEDY